MKLGHWQKSQYRQLPGTEKWVASGACLIPIACDRVFLDRSSAKVGKQTQTIKFMGTLIVSFLFVCFETDKILGTTVWAEAPKISNWWNENAWEGKWFAFPSRKGVVSTFTSYLKSEPKKNHYLAWVLANAYNKFYFQVKISMI